MDFEGSSDASGEYTSSAFSENLERTIVDAPIEDSSLDSFLSRGRHVVATAHPYLNQGLAWISSNTRSKNSQSGNKAPFEIIESSLFQIPNDYAGQFQRQRTGLTLDLAAIFEGLQRKFEDGQNQAEIRAIIFDASNQYRERISEALNQLIQYQQTEELGEADEVWQQALIDSINVRRCAEAIHFLPTSESLVCDHLMDWVNNMDPRPSQQEGEDIMTAQRPYLHPGFWDYVSKGILRGLLEMVVSCLSNSGLHTIDSATSQATNDLCLLLRTCPRASKYLDNPQNFRERHRIWRTKVVKASKEFSLADPDITTAFRQVYELLKGDKDAVYRQSDSWQECLASLALLFDPAGLRGPKDVQALFDMIIESDDFGLAVDRTLASEEACAAFCGGNVPAAITKCRSVDLALTSHLADLLDKIEVLDVTRSGDLDMTICEMLALAHGDACIADPGCWRAAITYWKIAGDAGFDSIQQVLVRILVTSQEEVDELLETCRDLDFFDEAAEIESIWARKLENQGRYHAAIRAYDNAENPHQIDRLNWAMTRSSLIAGKIATDDTKLLDSLQTTQSTTSTTISTMMAPFATLATMYRLKAAGDYKSAAQHLSALIKSPDVPRSYMGILMAEMLPFLQLPHEQSFSMRDILDSLAAMEEFYDSEHFEDGLSMLDSALSSAQKGNAGSSIDWRSEVRNKLEAHDVLAHVRLRIAQTLASRFSRE